MEEVLSTSYRTILMLFMLIYSDNTHLSHPCLPGLFQEGGSQTSAGVIRLTSFNARAQRDVKASIQELERSGAQRLVLDLRDNRGGLVSEGLEVRVSGAQCVTVREVYPDRKECSCLMDLSERNIASCRGVSS